MESVTENEASQHW